MNLARKWRSKHFEELVGQPLVVRLVKNSLYRNLIFPVYLLSGTRGTGKTSIARIFAAALNCQELEAFQKNPQGKQVPCLACTSCTAMRAMNHPDFIEMDAASHTGVDNVRQIIEAASFVPALGKKKIYLIDEAHMLSKAAFNALLKMLEEPPASVVFMLATTDPHKILGTVTSRCFQLFFEPIKHEEVVRHLEYVCTQEELTFEKEALFLVAHETEGSMRDALNLIERLRIAYPHINKQAVIELLGCIDDDRLIELFDVIMQGPIEEILAACVRLELKKYNAQIIWKKLVDLIRLMLWIKNGVEPHQGIKSPRLNEIAIAASYEKLIALFELCYTYERAFAKTAEPASMLEMMLLKMHLLVSSGEPRKPERVIPPQRQAPVSSRSPQGAVQNSVASHANKNRPPALGKEPLDQQAVEVKPVVVPEVLEAAKKPSCPWQACFVEIEKLNDPLVASIFRQGVNEKYDADTCMFEMSFPSDLAFFKEWLHTTKKMWEPLIVRFFGEKAQFVAHFNQASTKERPLKRVPIPPANPVVQADVSPKKGIQAKVPQKSASPAKALVPDAENWQKSHMLSKIFPGTLMMKEGESA